MRKKNIISKAVSMAVLVTMLFTNTYVNGADTSAETVQEESAESSGTTAAESAKTETPEPTGGAEPAAAPTPSEGAGTTETPEPTKDAETTGTPEPTKAAGESGTPEPTKGAETTGTPEPTDGAETTITPEPTGGADVTITPEPTGGAETTLTPEPTGGAEITETPEPTGEVEPTPEETPSPSPEVSPALQGAPKLLSLTGKTSRDSLEKMTPAFDPDTYNYYFLDNRGAGDVRTMTAAVDPGVTVTVDGTEVEVDESGVCTLCITYRTTGSANMVVLTRTETGETSTYVFHTFTYAVRNYSGSYALVNSEGEEDTASIGAFQAKTNTPVYEASVNLEKVRLQMAVSPGENNVFSADLVDGSGKVLDSFLFAGGEEGESTTLQSKVLRLTEGQNVFFLKCYGSYTALENGELLQGDGVYTVAFFINRNETEDPAVNNNTSLKSLGLYLNEVGGSNYLAGFSPETKKYKLKLSVEEFNEALEMNDLYLTVASGDEGQTVKVYGGSYLKGIPGSDLKKQDDGSYRVARYNADDLYSSDSFTIQVQVQASDHITKDTYVITVEKDGKSGMLVPDIYRHTRYYIVPSRPERKMQLVLSSTKIYDNGTLITGGKAASKGYLKIEIEDTSVIYLAAQQLTSSDFTVWLNSPGTTKVKMIYDDGKAHYEDEVLVSVYYNGAMLYNEITIAEDLLEDEGRAYAEGAEDTFRAALQAARLVYGRCGNTTLNDEQAQAVTDAVISLRAAEEVFKRSEIGQKITAFVALDDSVATQYVANGASILRVKRPKTLDVIIDGETVTLSGIKWTSRPTWQVKVDEATIYRFTPTLPAGYVLADGVDYPVITVSRSAKTLAVEVKKTIKLEDSILVQHVPVGTKKSELNFPACLEMYKQEGTGDDGGRYQIPVVWKDVDRFDGNTPGTYTFVSVLNALPTEFKLASNTTQNPMQTITVIVDEPEKKEDGSGGDGGSGDGGGTDDGSGNGSGSGSGSGEGKGTGNGNGSGSGDGSGNGSGSGSGSGNGSGNGNGTNRQHTGHRQNSDHGNKNDNNTNTNSGSTQNSENPAKNGNGIGTEETKPASETAGEASSEEAAAEEGLGGFEKTKATSTQEGGGSSDEGGNQSKKEGTGKKKGEKTWTVSELVGDTVVSHVREMVLLLLVLFLLLLHGGYREYRRQKSGK